MIDEFGNVLDVKRYHAMLLHFLQESNGTFRTTVDLKAYEIDSQRKVSNITVQELCKIHPDLRILHLTDCDISDVALWTISKYTPLLTGIYLSGCHQISNIGLRSFSLTCTQLSTIDLSRCPQLDNAGLSSIAAGCWKLEKIYLAHCTGITDDGLRNITICRLLQHLDLEGCNSIGDFGSRILKDLGQYCCEMKYINFLGCKRVEDAGMNAIAKGCPKLETFLGSGCDYVTGKGFKALLKYAMNLKTLVLRDCMILDDKDVHMAFKTRNESFINAKIEFMKNNPTFREQEGISVYLDSIIELDISGARLISDKGVLSIGNSSVATSLLSLNVSQCTITDTTATILANKFTKLRSLDLSICPQLTDATIHSLALGVTGMSTLKINNNDKVSMGAIISHIGEALPFADLATSWVGYQVYHIRGIYNIMSNFLNLPKQPKLNYLEYIRMAELRHLHQTKALFIQSIVRRKLAYLRYYKLCCERLVNRAIPRAQALIRCRQQRKRYHTTMLELLRNKMVTLIQSQYRKWVEKVKLGRKVKARRLLAFQTVQARLLQRVFRGMMGRRRAQHARDIEANVLLQEARAQAKRELKAVIIQRHWRARFGRNIANSLKAEKSRRLQEERLRVQSARHMQRTFRGLLGRNVAAGIRGELYDWKLKWYHCLRIQRVFRGHIGKRISSAAKTRHMNERRNKAATAIQCAYRQRVAHGWCVILQAERARRKLHHNLAIDVQRQVRGFIARQRVSHLLDLIREKNRQFKAALLFQRVFRGHKGREAVEVERALLRVDEIARPLSFLVHQHMEQLEFLTKQIESVQIVMNGLRDEISESELELNAVNKSREKHADSTRLNKTPQRFITKYLRVRLKDYVLQKMEDYEREKLTLNSLNTKSNEAARMIRLAKRELIPLTTGCVAKVKAERGKRLRTQVRLRVLSVTKIQTFWRGYEIKKGYRDVARDYWILCTDEEQTEQVYYFNTWTQETSWNPPFIFKYIKQPPVTSVSEEDEQSEGDDNSSLEGVY